MGKRKTPLINGFYYHIFNRGVDGRLIFETKWDYKQFFITINYYRFSNVPFRLSRFKDLVSTEKIKLISELVRCAKKRVEIICYCLMPNHFHLLIQQISENGTSDFMKLIQDSYTKYFNQKYRRTGVLFSGNFKSVLIESDEQLLHLSRYIYLNPYSSGVISTIGGIFDYSWSSMGELLNKSNNNIVNSEILLKFFNNKKEKFKKFILDNADYQKRLRNITHLTME